MYGYIYKISIDNEVSSMHMCYYIGSKIINRKEKTYFGSGKFINKYTLKYAGYRSSRIPEEKAFKIGLKKEILQECNSLEELNLQEAVFIGDLYLTDAFLKGGKCLNLLPGGNAYAHKKETKQKISKNTRNFQSEETRLKISKNSAHTNIGKHWWTNGESQVFSVECPIGFQKGISNENKIKKSKANKDLIWYNNGIINKKFSIDIFPGIEWNKGRLPIKYSEEALNKWGALGKQNGKIIPTLETRKKISKALLGNTNNSNSKKCLCIELNTEFISCAEASRHLGHSGYGGCKIAECCRGKRETAYGYHWEFLE